ncbi:MAG: MarR family transcriptional regulator, partial [Acetobacter orientalis]
IAMDTDCSALVRVLDLLVKEGFVARQPDVQDRRAKHIMLTPSGQQRCALFHQVAAQVEQDMTQTLPLPDRKPLIALLDTVLATPPELSA